MTITTKAMAKVAVVAIGLAIAMSMLSLAPTARAATCSFTTSLTVGSTGAAVTCLQQSLIANGYSIPAGATGYFGMQTKAAVAAWQAASGVSPAVGYFGPISRAAFTLGGSTGGSVSTVPGCAPGALFSSTTGQACGSTTGSTSALAGTDGNISDVDVLGTYNNENVSENQNNVIVLGADVEASNDGDIALRSVKVNLDSTGNTGSDNLTSYVDTVSVYLGSTKVGSADAADFNEDSTGVFTKTITLSNAVIRANQVGKLYVKVDAVSNIDSGDITGDSWTVDIDSIRFEDGSGVVTTDTTTGAINAMNVTINFVSFATSADTELKISTATDTAQAGIVLVDNTSDTNNVSLLKGKLKLEGTSDAVLDQFPVTLTVTGAADIDLVTGSLTLKIGNETFSETVSTATLTTATVTFDNLDFAIDGGDTVSFEVLADINDIESGDFDEGDTLLASITASNRSVMDIENSQGDQLDDSSEKSGTATGEAQEFRTNGIMLTLVSTSAASNLNDAADTGTFKIKFKVTALGDTVYLTSLTTAATYTTDRSGTATTAGNISSAIVNTTDTSLTSVGNYLIEDGSSETLEMTVIIPNGTGGTAGLYRTVLTGVKWDTADDNAATANTYSSNLDSFKTDYVFLDAA